MAMAVSSQQSRDAALLRATTELFVLDKTHVQAGIRRFEELAAHFLTKVSAADRAFVAERLARHPDTPGLILRMLGKDLPEIASPVLRHAPGLNSFDILAIMAATGPVHCRMIATRRDLAPDIVSALRMTGDAETIALLPAIADEAPEPQWSAPVLPELATLENLLAQVEAMDSMPATVDELSIANEPEASAPEPEATASATEAPNHPPAPKAIDPLSALAAARVLTASLSAEMAALATERPAEPSRMRRHFEPLTRPVAAAPRLDLDALILSPAPIERASATVEVAIEAPVLTAELAAAEPQEPSVVETPVANEAENDTVPTDPAAAFLRLDRADRLALIAALSPTPLSTQKMSSIQIDYAFRTALSRARLPMLARQHKREALIGALAEGLRLDLESVTALLDDPSGEALVVLLKAIGLSDTEAQQVLLFANPVMRDAVEAFHRLTELLAGVTPPAANRLVGQWRGDAEPEAVHQPHYTDLARRDVHPGVSERSNVQEKPAWAEKIA